jgi:3-oxoacyl-[acyl-carrier-protein] synthase-3
MRYSLPLQTWLGKIGAINAWGLIRWLPAVALQPDNGASLIESGDIKVVVVGAKMSSIVTIATEYLYYFGDGAGAVRLEPNFEGYGIGQYSEKTAAEKSTCI